MMCCLILVCLFVCVPGALYNNDKRYGSKIVSPGHSLMNRNLNTYPFVMSSASQD
jgi:hypothetical protein